MCGYYVIQHFKEYFSNLRQIESLLYIQCYDMNNRERLYKIRARLQDILLETNGAPIEGLNVTTLVRCSTHLRRIDSSQEKFRSGRITLSVKLSIPCSCEHNHTLLNIDQRSCLFKLLFQLYQKF